jgi:hypothetical protein
LLRDRCSSSPLLLLLLLLPMVLSGFVLKATERR